MITVFAYYTPNFQALAAVTLPNILRYCLRHGYGVHIHFDQAHAEDPRPFGFRKTEAALACLQRMGHGDILCVLDIDLLITNQTIRLESFVTPEHDLFFTHDINGLNAGVYLARAAYGTTKFFETVLGLVGKPGVHGEQDAIRDALLISAFGQLCKIVQHPSFNSFMYAEYGKTMEHHQGEFHLGDFILHLPGIGMDRRIEILSVAKNFIVE